MKNVFLFLFLMAASSGFAQMINIDTVSFIKPGTEEPVLDASVTSQLEAFTDQDDAVIYIYRLKSMAGAAVKWLIEVDDKEIARLKQKDYVVVHIDTKAKSHHVRFADFRYNFVNFKPNHYYAVVLKGFSHGTGYLNAEAFEDIKTCEKIEPSAK